VKPVIIAVIIVILVVAIGALMITPEKEMVSDIDEPIINNFEECIAAGNPAMESYPRQCRTPDGEHFVESIQEEQESATESSIPEFYWTDEDGNLIKPETTDRFFDKENPLAEIFEFDYEILRGKEVPNCEYDFAYLDFLYFDIILEVTVMCYNGNWYLIIDHWRGIEYRLPF